MARDALGAQLPNLVTLVRSAIQIVIDGGRQLVNLGLSATGLDASGPGIGAAAVVLFFIALKLRYCFDLAANVFAIPVEAISHLENSGIQASQTSSSCPPSRFPLCNK